jgi:predicted nucleotidyltransferase
MAILRVLQDNREGMSGRAIAREAGINHQVCAQALRHLEGLGLLQRQGQGRTQLIRFHFDNYLVKELIFPLLKRERDFQDHMRQDIAKAFRGKALTITVFGSVARGQDVPGSDIDVLIVSEGSNKNQALEKATGYSAEFKRKYGLRLSPIVMTPLEARRRAKSSEPLFKNILTEGIDLLPYKLQEVLR